MAKKNPRQRVDPYTPSYINRADGPVTCKVCGDNASGYHYAVMTCEGCKSFFRRTIQNNLKHVCIRDKNCDITKNSRARCQNCRFQRCIETGMSTKLVLDAKQREEKRKLIADNRKKKQAEKLTKQLPPAVYSAQDVEFLTDIKTAFHLAFVLNNPCPVQILKPKFHFHELIHNSMAESFQRACTFFSNIACLKQMCAQDISYLMHRHVLLLVYTRSILLFPRRMQMINQYKPFLYQCGLINLVREFENLSQQFAELCIKSSELLLLPLFIILNDCSHDVNFINPEIVLEIRGRMANLLPPYWMLPKQQSLLQSVQQSCWKHEENVNILRLNMSSIYHVCELVRIMFNLAEA